MTTLYELRQELIQEIDEWWANGGYNASYPYDELHEMVDSSVPIYNREILEVAMDEMWLAVTQPEFEYDNPLNGISLNIYEALYEDACTRLRELELEEEDFYDCEDCGDKLRGDIIVEEDDHGNEMYYHPECSPSERELKHVQL